MNLVINRPIFVIGSPRSGTSILTWCLGQHSNILVQEESNWLGRFTLDVEAAYLGGTHRAARSQLSALGVRREIFFASFGHAINELILTHRRKLITTAQQHALQSRTPVQETAEFKYERSESDPKARWVDGTPEHSFYVCGLRKLFPEARFIHIVRRAAAVVRSMLHFERAGGRRLVANEEEGYAYWLRRANACALAERAYGPGIVHRVRHADLVAQPEMTMRGLLDFLHEPYEVACLEPLRLRINSSDVPVDFEARHPVTNRKVMETALALEDELIDGKPPASSSSLAASELEAEFENQVRHVRNVSDYHSRAVNRIAQLEKEMEKLKTAESNKQRRRWFPNKK